MGLFEDARAGLGELLGAEGAEEVLRTFDDPHKYPKDFLEEYLFFMAKLVGEEAAKRKAAPLYEKYSHRAISVMA